MTHALVWWTIFFGPPVIRGHRLLRWTFQNWRTWVTKVLNSFLQSILCVIGRYLTMKTETSSHYKRFKMLISIWQLIKFQAITRARLVKNLGGLVLLERFANRHVPNVLFINLSITYVLNFFCPQGSLALGRLVSIPIALFLSPAIMLLVDLVG